MVLPHDGNALPLFVQGLTADKFSAHIAQLRQRKGTIELPRFSLTYDTSLNKTLSKLGMGIAFEHGADFSGIPQGPAQLRISDVKHASFLNVDEEGTEAAAATSIGIRATAIRPVIPPFHMIRNMFNMIRCGTATSAYNIYISLVGPVFEIMPGVFRFLIVFTHCIR